MSYCIMCGTKLEGDATICANCANAAESYDSQPVYEAPQPEYAAPQPNYANYQPNYANSQPNYANPQPNYANPQPNYAPRQYNEPGKLEGLPLAAFILMIVGIVAQAWLIIPLAWCIPMTVIYYNKIKRNEPVGTGFKVCTLLFVNTISGILMLVDDKH